MNARTKALIWATIIIAAAFVAKSHGLSDGVSFSLIAGLSGAAWASISSRQACGSGCLQ